MMKKILAVVMMTAAFLAAASDVYERTITSTGTASTPVQLRTGNYLITCDTAAKMNAGRTSSVTVTSSAYAVWLEAGRAWPFYVDAGHRYVTVISVSGTSNCVFARVVR